MHYNSRFIGLFIVVIALGCSDPDSDDGNGEPIPDRLIVTGELSELSPVRGVSPLRGATLVARVDTNDDGLFDDGDVTVVEVDESAYRIEIPLESRRSVSILVRSSLAATATVEVVGGPGERVTRDISLPALEQLGCGFGRCVGADVQITGLPTGITARAAALSPIGERTLFPGSWGTDEGALLESGGFMFAALRGADGSDVNELDQPAELTFELPIESWGELRDIEPGNGAIDVPFYAFDDTIGTWTRDGAAVLVDALGAPIPESELSSVQSGAYSGSVSARGAVSHFSFWNVDFPLEQVSSVAVQLDFGVPANETPSLVIDGITYDGGGVVRPTNNPDVFCVRVRRSEPEGEDDDANGESGEVHRSRILVQRGNTSYEVEFEHPVDTASCDDPIDLGALEVSEGDVREPQVCTVEGRITDLAGLPGSGAVVRAYDPSLSPAVIDAVCDGNCDDSVVADVEGNFTINAPVGRLLGISAVAFLGDGTRSGREILEGCPAEPIEFVLNSGVNLETLDVTVESGSIAWTPDSPMGSISVGRDGDSLWQIVWNGTRFAPPVTYGTVPEGALQTIPADGSPPALESGDFIRVLGTGPGELYRIQYEGTFTVP